MRVDLNADVGESDGDLVLLDVVTSANVCCGAYAGGPDLMLTTCEAATERGVAIGAQVGYADREGFGRRPMEPAAEELVEELRRQVDLLAEVADAVGERVRYVKPHGALYNAIVRDERQAAAVVEAVLPYGLPLVGLPGSASLRRAAAEGLETVPEGFADRAYRDGTLVPRSEPGALLEDPAAAAAQAVRLLQEDVASICVHGDTPGAVTIARAVRSALADAGVELAPFA